MTSRDRIVILVVAVVAVVAGSWLLVIQPKRQQAAKLGSQVNAEQSQLDSARQKVAAGEAARREFAGNYAELARLGEAVPADDNVPSLIFELQGAASQSGVDFRSLQISSSPTTSSTSSSSSSSGQASSQPLPPGVSAGAAGFPAEQFTFMFSGDFFHLADFFGHLQRFVQANNGHVAISGRLITVNSISFAPGPKGFPQIAATVAATTYLLPASQGLTAGATAAGPAGGSSGAGASAPAPSTSSTPTPAAAAVTPPAQ